jgi:hypothetical protein
MDSCVERQQLARNPPQKREQFLRSPSPAYATEGLVADSMYVRWASLYFRFFFRPTIGLSYSSLAQWLPPFVASSVCRGLSTVVWLPSSPGRCNFLLAAFNSIYIPFALFVCVCVCDSLCLVPSPVRASQAVRSPFCVCYFFLSSWLSTLRPFFFSFSFFFLYGVSCQCMWKL